MQHSKVSSYPATHSEVARHFNGRPFGWYVLEKSERLTAHEVFFGRAGESDIGWDGLSDREKAIQTDWINQLFPLVGDSVFHRLDGSSAYDYVFRRAKSFMNSLEFEVSDEQATSMFFEAFWSFASHANTKRDVRDLIMKAIGVGFFDRRSGNWREGWKR